MPFQKQFLCPRSESGSILIMCMWILVFFSVLSAGLYSAVSSWIRIAKLTEDRAAGEGMANAACVYFQASKKNDVNSYDSFYELNAPVEKNLGMGKFVYSVVDEESKININTVSQDTLSKLPGMTNDLAKSVNESELKPFLVKEEIMSVDGITQEIFDKCRDFISTYSSGQININTAPEEVLIALGVDETVVSARDRYRAGEDMKDVTEDDGVFENVGEIITKLRQVTALSGAQESLLLQLISKGALTTASKTFCLKITTYISNRPGMKYNIILDNERIKQWKEY